MKWIEFYKNKWNIAITVLSLLSIIPLIFFVKNLLGITALQDIAHTSGTVIKDTLSMSFSNSTVLIPFVCGLVVWTLASVTAAIAVSKKQTRGWFGIISLFLGGVGLHLILSPLVLIPQRKVKKQGKTLVYVGSSLGAIATIVPVAALIAYQNNSKPVVAPQIKLSTQADKPNLIEIFSDGLDLHDDEIRSMWENNVDFKDFNLFNNFMTAGHPTHLSVPMINGDFDKYNPFQMTKDFNGLTGQEFVNKDYADKLIYSITDHMGFDKDQFSNRTIINPVNYSTTSNYTQSVAGDPAAIQKIDKDLGVTNWDGARDDLYGSWGVSSKSPDYESYEWLSKNMIVNGDASQNGARVYIEDMITHRPFLNDGNGNFTTYNFDMIDQIKTLQKSIVNVINSLKAASAYDNTMIVIYGDHASHDFVPADGNGVRDSESALFIKYPKANNTQTNKLNVINDRFVYGAQINSIISDYFKQKDSFDLNTYFASNRFDNKPRPLFMGSDVYAMAQWDISNPTEHKIIKLSEVNYDNQNIDKQLTDLHNLRMGGDF